MNKVKELILKRFPKYFMGNLLGTLVDTVVLWLFSHLVFKGYVGQCIISPFISFEWPRTQRDGVAGWRCR